MLLTLHFIASDYYANHLTDVFKKKQPWSLVVFVGSVLYMPFIGLDDASSCVSLF